MRGKMGKLVAPPFVPVDKIADHLRSALKEADQAYEIAKSALGETHPVTQSVLEAWADLDDCLKGCAS